MLSYFLLNFQDIIKQLLEVFCCRKCQKYKFLSKFFQLCLFACHILKYGQSDIHNFLYIEVNCVRCHWALQQEHIFHFIYFFYFLGSSQKRLPLQGWTKGQKPIQATQENVWPNHVDQEETWHLSQNFRGHKNIGFP